MITNNTSSNSFREFIETSGRKIYIDTKGSRNHFRVFKRDFVQFMVDNFSDIVSEQKLHTIIDNIIVRAERGYGFGTEGFFNNIGFSTKSNLGL